jgi:hypothetical protein
LDGSAQLIDVRRFSEQLLGVVGFFGVAQAAPTHRRRHRHFSFRFYGELRSQTNSNRNDRLTIRAAR